jgi:hypothetical protein
MLLSHHHNAEQNHDIKRANGYFENVAVFRYLGMTATNQNLIQEDIKSRVNSGNACYHSVQKLLFSHLLSKNKNYNMLIVAQLLKLPHLSFNPKENYCFQKSSPLVVILSQTNTFHYLPIVFLSDLWSSG